MNPVILEEKHLTETFSLSENRYFHFSHFHTECSLLIILTYIRFPACSGVIAEQYFALSKDMNTCSMLEDQEDFLFVVGMAGVLMKPQTKHTLL